MCDASAACKTTMTTCPSACNAAGTDCNACAAGETMCTNGCQNLSNDPDNCGMCGRVCADPPVVGSGSATCSASACGFVCNASYLKCGGTTYCQIAELGVRGQHHRRLRQREQWSDGGDVDLRVELGLPLGRAGARDQDQRPGRRGGAHVRGGPPPVRRQRLRSRERSDRERLVLSQPRLGHRASAGPELADRRAPDHEHGRGRQHDQPRPGRDVVPGLDADRAAWAASSSSSRCRARSGPTSDWAGVVYVDDIVIQ